MLKLFEYDLKLAGRTHKLTQIRQMILVEVEVFSNSREFLDPQYLSSHSNTQYMLMNVDNISQTQTC